MANLTTLGKMNWVGLLGYTIQPADMDLFQQYVFGQASNRLAGERGPGVIYGCVLTVVAGMQVQVGAGLLVMPDGTLIQTPPVTATLGNGDPTNPRIDRIEIKYVPTNNTQVESVTNIQETLDILFVPSINVVPGTPAPSPSIPASTGSNVSVGAVAVPATATSLSGGNLSQVVDTSLLVSPFLFDTNGQLRYNRSIAQFQISSNAGATWQLIQQSSLPEMSALIANNQSSLASVTALILDQSQGTSYKLSVEITRITSAGTVKSFGDLLCYFDPVASKFVVQMNSIGDDTGMSFDSVQIGSSTQYQVQYTSSNLMGTGYSGVMKFALINSL